MNKRLSFSQVVPTLGGRYLLLVIAVVQVIALAGIIPGIISIRTNAEFNEQQTRAILILTPIFMLLSYGLLLGISGQLTPTARKRLDQQSNPLVRLKPDDELKAWREITSLNWRYGIAAGVVIFIVNILPIVYISFGKGEMIASVFQPTALSSPIPMYVLLGGLVSLIGYVIASMLLIERFTLPVRLFLLPKDFETQLKGRSGPLLNSKFILLTLALLAVAILLSAPIGYHQTVRVLYAEISSFQIFDDLQFQSILFSVLALLLGGGFSYYLSKSVSDPVSDLIRTLNKIEQGDLSQRVPVSATDELGIVMVQFNKMVSRLEELQFSLEQQVAERTKQLAVSNEVGKAAASSLDPDQMIARIVNLFPEQFDYYYAAVYLLDPSGRWADLKEATGEAGRVLKQNRHRLEITGKSMIGLTLREKTPHTAQAVSLERQRAENPLLPYTRSEITLPLMVGDHVLGALDIQSTRESDFGLEVIESMTTMAGQVAIALENARLFQEAQQVIKEMRAVQQQYLLEGWSGFTEQNKELEYGVGDETDINFRKLDVPISLRDQIFGQISLEGKSDWSPEQQSLVDAVATQAAIALENARLVSESRQIAVRERMLSEINSKIWASATIDGVLQTVVKELGRRLDASQATIELDMDQDHE